MKHVFSKMGKCIIAMVLCFAMLLSSMSFSFAVVSDEADGCIELYNYAEVYSRYLTYNAEAAAEYPKGAFMFPLSSSELSMDNIFAMDIFREGGTEGEAAITLKFHDLTAKYGIDYEIYDELNGEAIEGEANPFYDIEEYSFLATPTQKEIIYSSNQEGDVELLRENGSEYNDLAADVMPTSGELKLTFANGENSKRIYIKTYKPQTVTSNLEFTLDLCNPENASIGAQTSCAFTILEEREQPETVLTLCEGKVNPESEEAYITVKRSGNMGTRGSFVIRTESASAKAAEDYEAVQISLDFTPGMSEIKVPVAMLGNAQSGTYFDVHLEDVENATAENQTEKMLITDDVPPEAAHSSAFTETVSLGSMVNTNTGTRGTQIVDLKQFTKHTVTSRGTGSQDYAYKSNGSKMRLEYDNNWSSKNNCISVRSNEKINFTGVDSISMTIDNLSGSTVSDDNVIYVSDSDKFNSSTGDYDWINNMSGYGAAWDMTNIADSVIVRTCNLSQSKVKGEHYLFIALHKGAVVGYAGYDLYNEGTSNVSHNLRLNMTKYNITIVEPDPVQMYVDGTLVTKAVANNHLMVDPGSLHDNDNNTKTTMDIYRDETTAISAVVDSTFNGMVRMDGVYLCESGNLSNHSELIPLNGNSFTLTSSILEKYESFIKDKKIVIKPHYTVSTVNFKVESFDNTSITGMKFVADNKACTGELYQNGTHIGTLSWTKSTRSNGEYYIADTLKFNFSFSPGISSSLWKMQLDTRAAAQSSLLSSAEVHSVTCSTFSGNITLSDLYFSVTPNFSLSGNTTVLKVNNPSLGGFSGKGSKYTVENPDGTATVTGYGSSDGTADTVFGEMSVGQIITFWAKPNDGYRAKWTYTDSTTHTRKTYYGDSFFFMIQNPYYATDNLVTLSFEARPSGSKTVTVTGQTQMQEGTVIAPPTSHSQTYNLAAGAQVTFGAFGALSNTSGEFSLSEDPNADTPVLAKVTVSSDETHRAMVFYNNQYYLCDVKMSDILTEDNDSIYLTLKMTYRTTGATPTDITAYSSDGTLYGDTITLISANAVQFDLFIDTKGQDANRPVNMVRWTIENDDGIKSTYDVELEKGQTVSHWANVLSEIVKQGDKLCVELMWKGYDDDADEILASYGKFDTGYNFIATSVAETITYAPDIGVPSTMSQPIPVLGPVSPTVSVKGFTPIINTGVIGTDKEGREIHTVTLGVSFGKLKNYAEKGSGWDSFSPLDKAKSMGKILDEYDTANNSPSGLPANAKGAKLANALNMKTSVNVSFSVTVCYQGNYFVDDTTGEWCFVSNLLIIGAGGNIQVSMPFVLCYIPCFAYFTVGINANIYMGIFGQTDGATGTTVALTLDQLDDAEASTFQGVYELKINLGVGVGIGFDALLCASGGVDLTFDIQFNDFMRGYGTVAMSGTISLELLFLKASWTAEFFEAEMFNTLQDAESFTDVARLASSVENNLLKNTTIGDMVIASATYDEVSSDGPLRAGVIEEKVIEGNSTIVNPEIIALGNDRYLIVTTATDSATGNENVIHYYIYDESSNSVLESDSILKKAVRDNYGENAAELAEEMTKDLYKIDHDAVMVDCGEEVLIAWNKCVIDRESTNADLLNSIGIATIFYNKESGKFHGYNMLSDPASKNLLMTPKLVYNAQTGDIQLFYQIMSTDDITLDTTLEEIQAKPTALMTSSYDVNENMWSQSKVVTINGEYLKYFDATAYGDQIMLSYVASNSYGFTLEATDGYTIDESFDTSMFNSKNSLYIELFDSKDGELISTNPIKLTGDGFVTANPQFATINTGEISNTLLFYKCNGRYAYQNITNILTNGLYTTSEGMSQITEAYVEPIFITDDDDYSINDDLRVYSHEGGDIYALWTTTEGNQQQIWARQFVFDEIKVLTETNVLDENGITVYDSNGNPVTEKLSSPLYVLEGFWGGKVYLTEDTVNGHGLYKDNFSAAVLDNGRLLTVFNAGDREIKDDTCNYINNMLVIAEYETDTEYIMPEAIDAIEANNLYPTENETVTITCHAENVGVKSGRNVEISLYADGELYDTLDEYIWLSAEAKHFEFFYTLPDGTSADSVTLYYTISENGVVKLTSDTFTFEQDAKVELTGTSLTPLQFVTEDKPYTKFLVKATVTNTGNENYTGGDFVRLVSEDVQALLQALEDESKTSDTVYTSLGKTALPEIEVGHSKEIVFITDEIPAEIFETTDTDTAYLETIISSGSESDWSTKTASEEMSMLSSFYPGLTKKPVPQKAKSLELLDINVAIGESKLMEKEVTPLSALATGVVLYTSSDPTVASIDANGVITALKAGTVTITAELDGIEATAQVTVTEEPIVPTEPATVPNPDNDPDSDKGGSETDKDTVPTGDIVTYSMVALALAVVGVVLVIIISKRKQSKA